MTSTQHFIPFDAIQDDLIYLRDGSVSLVLSTSAVNFGLLFETEQLSIIEAFARLLNSLSFPIQIVIHSKHLDVSAYLHTLDDATNKQTNPLLKTLSLHYRQFVESIIREKNVLDKQFYVCLNVTAPELGVLPKSVTERSKKALTVLLPRRDHLISQLSRLGLKAKQLSTPELIKLLYDIYNPPANKVAQPDLSRGETSQPQIATARPKEPEAPAVVKPPVPLTRLVPNPQARITPDTYRPPTPFPPNQQAASAQPTQPSPLSVAHLSPPFVVEELSDDFGP